MTPVQGDSHPGQHSATDNTLIKAKLGCRKKTQYEFDHTNVTVFLQN